MDLLSLSVKQDGPGSDTSAGNPAEVPDGDRVRESFPTCIKYMESTNPQPPAHPHPP